MTKLISLTELLFKGMLASYLLFYAFQIHKHPLKFTGLFQDNLQGYGKAIGIQLNLQGELGNYLLYYCQFLVIVSLCIVSGMRLGRILGWMVIIVNLLLGWSKTEMLFVGIHLIFIGIVI